MKAVVAGLLAILVATSASAEEKRITLPPDNAYALLAPGLHGDLAQTQCQFCHSTDYIVMQPRGGAAQWEAVVSKMIKVFGAPTSEADAKAIVEYLTSAYGPKK
jgi:sulfite dehydrogenase (cytochrome) subunit B